MMASLGGEERHGVSPELREMNRMVWGTQADVNSLVPRTSQHEGI